MRLTGFTIKLLAVVAVFLSGGVLFFLAAGGLSIWIELYLDLPIANEGILYGSMAGGLVAAVAAASFFRGKKKWWKVCLPLFAVLVAAATLYSVNYRSGPPYEYTGSSRQEILETLKKKKNRPRFQLSINSENRAAHALTAGKPKTFHLNRKPGEPLSFAAGAPGLQKQNIRLEVSALVSGNVTHPVYKTPALDPETWNEFIIPAEKLNPSMQSFRVRLLPQGPLTNDSPLVFVTDLERERDLQGPNVLVVMVDTFRADRLDAETAPFLTRFMQKSVVMEQTMAPSSWTVPSTASLLTGLYPHQHGYISNAHMEFKKVELISGHFKSKGYRTAGVSSNRLIDPRYGFARGFDQFIALGRVQHNYLNSGRILNLRAKEWMEKHREQTFFLYLHYMDPHYPYLAPPPDTFFQSPGRFFQKIESLYSFFRYDNRDFSNQWLIDHPEAVPLVVSRYKGEIRYWDRQFQDLVGFMKEQGLLKNTIIVVVSDHGEAFGEHGNYRHGSSLFQEEVHVPLIIHDGRNPRSLRVRKPVSALETAKIISGLAGIEPSETWHGRTLQEILDEGKDGKKLASVLSYRHFHPMEGDPESVKVSLAARHGDKKIILKYDARTGAEKKMLFDLAEDPHEKQNLWKVPESENLPLYQWMINYLPPPDSMTYQPQEQDRQLKKDLKALGYVK
ncbi:MAG: sulfatase [bacterium]